MNDFQDVSESIPSTEQRVALHTPAEINEQIRQRMEERVAYYAAKLDQVQQRLDELQKEWDIERTLETNAAAVGLTGVVMSILFGRGWLLLPLTVTGFLLQHAIQGWCPPVELFRRLGVRTADEINTERTALKALRGDFKDLPIDQGDCVQRAQSVLDAVRRNGSRTMSR